MFDFGSPTTYLAHTQLPRIARETGARVDYVPMLLGGVFKATGNQSPVTGAGQGPLDGRRPRALGARRYGVPFTFNPHFPINTLTLMRGAVGSADAAARSLHARMSTPCSAAMWVEPVRTWATRSWLARRWAQAGFDA